MHVGIPLTANLIKKSPAKYICDRRKDTLHQADEAQSVVYTVQYMCERKTTGSRVVYNLQRSGRETVSQLRLIIVSAITEYK